MNSLLELVQSRQSCRSFDPSRPVEREKLTACLQAACLAPSACNSQPWRYIAVDEPDRLPQLAACLQETGMNRFTGDARAFVVVVEGRQNLPARMGSSMNNQPFSGLDIGLSVGHLILSATDLGLGSCVIGWFNERKLKMLLGIPKTRRIRLVICLGYAKPEDPLREKNRRDFDETVSFNHF
ncbi:MAG: NAD(P)H nitroreductase [Oscillospiraceae bacterium]|nr:MAG: NAD(P)H nitroreductase [Oscillospiraceae bacterium]